MADVVNEDRARRNTAAILSGLASKGQSALAESLKLSEASISRWKSEQVDLCGKALAALGLKVVPETMKCYRPDAIAAIFTLARMTVENSDPRTLLWEEPSE